MLDRGFTSLARDGIMMVRPNAVPVRNFQVFGERSSGTNFVSHIVNTHLELKRCKLYGWKHGFPAMASISPRSLIIVLFRDAMPWLRSMYNKPWHTTDDIQALSFEDFLRCEWQTVVKGPINSLDQPLETKFTKALQLDRDPLTGKPFENIVQLRNAKNRGFLSFAHRNCNVVLARLECVQAAPQSFLDQIADRFDVMHTSPYADFRESTGRGRWGRKRSVEAPKEIIKADRDFIVSQIDHEQEAMIGYTYD